jgi:putative membrane protein insertion efficiency factor
VSVAALVLRALVRLYQLTLAGVLPPSCRFEPSCSHYAMEALRQHGAMQGSVLTVRRVLRCNPWGGMGYDPVPAPRDGRAAADGRARPSTVLRF